MRLYSRDWGRAVVREWERVNPRVTPMIDYFIDRARDVEAEDPVGAVENAIISAVCRAGDQRDWCLIKENSTQPTQWQSVWERCVSPYRESINPTNVCNQVDLFSTETT